MQTKDGYLCAAYRKLFQFAQPTQVFEPVVCYLCEADVERTQGRHSCNVLQAGVSDVGASQAQAPQIMMTPKIRETEIRNELGMRFNSSSGLNR